MLKDIEKTNQLIAKFLVESYDCIYIDKCNETLEIIENEILAFGAGKKLLHTKPSLEIENLIFICDSIPKENFGADLLLLSEEDLDYCDYQVSFQIITKYIDDEKFDINKALKWKLLKKKLFYCDYLHNYKFLDRVLTKTKVKEIIKIEYVNIIDYKGAIKHYLKKFPILFKILRKIKNKLL